MFSQVSQRSELKHKEAAAFILKSAVKPDNKRVVAYLENPRFRLNVLFKLVILYLSLAYDFHCILLAAFLVLNQVDDAELAFAQLL